MSEDRIKALSERFRLREQEKAKTRRTYYLDAELVNQVDGLYRRLNYELEGISKSEFLEACLRFCLENLQEIETRLRELKKT